MIKQDWVWLMKLWNGRSATEEVAAAGQVSSKKNR